MIDHFETCNVLVTGRCTCPPQNGLSKALSDWAGRSKSGYYDEAQDDVVQILRQHRAFGSKP